MLQKKWLSQEVDLQQANQLHADLRIHKSLCALLVSRGIVTYDQARKFFRTSSSDLIDPFLMKGMNLAVNRIQEAISRQEKILIYGDYDVDGTTSVAVAYSFFKRIHPYIEYYIPHRFSEGYGVSEKGIQYAIDHEFKLIITLDCGIKSASLISKAKNHGIDTIVCDHHLPGDEIPEAIAILNPKQADCNYPYKELCGCGIAYKLISAYAKKFQVNENHVDDYLDLVATAIAADIVPITDENRTLCVLGLQKANSNPSIPLSALKQISDMNKEFTISDLVFIIAPRVNAAGRMDDARKAVELFIADNDAEAISLAAQLQEDNNDRRDIDKSTTAEAIEQLAFHETNQIDHATVVYQSHWHKGVVGIVASRLIDYRYCPTIVLTLSNGKITGSARSIKGFNMFEGLNQCSDYLENYGGHYYAAGLTMREENLLPFTKHFNEVVKQTIPSDMLQPSIDIDTELDLKDLTDSYMNILKQFAPHGPENMRPIFKAKKVMDYQSLSSIVKEKHIRFVIFQPGSKTINGIGFGLVDKFDLVKSGNPFDILFHIEENLFNGRTSLQLKVLDIRASES